MVMPPNRYLNKLGPFLFVFILLNGTGLTTHAQRVTPEVINYSSWTHSESFSFVSVSFGEMAIKTISGPGGIITQGFLQPEVEEPCSELKIDYYPNPVHDIMTILDSECNRFIEKVEIIDTYGKLVRTNILDNRRVSFKLLAQGVYIVRAYGANNDFLGSFKVIRVSDN